MLKKSILPLLAATLLLLFTNCQNDKPAAGGGTGQATASTNSQPADFVGYWVNKRWWEDLKENKSPRLAQGSATGIAGAIILENEGRIIGNLSYNWHEGEQLTLRTKEGQLQLYDPNNAANQPLTFVPQPDGTVMMDSTPMMRLGKDFEGVKLPAHEVLGGQYERNGQTVVFNPNGSVVGLDQFRYYEMVFDYVVDQCGSDMMSLSIDGSDPVFFAFKREGDRLLISELLDGGDDGQYIYKVGKVRYDLKRK
jgi:hypothetical protein